MTTQFSDFPFVLQMKTYDFDRFDQFFHSDTLALIVKTYHFDQKESGVQQKHNEIALLGWANQFWIRKYIILIKEIPESIKNIWGICICGAAAGAHSKRADHPLAYLLYYVLFVQKHMTSFMSQIFHSFLYENILFL